MEIFDKKGRNTVKVVSRDAPGYTGDLKISEQYPKILLINAITNKCRDTAGIYSEHLIHQICQFSL